MKVLETDRLILRRLFVGDNAFADSPERTAQSAVLGANPNGETPPGTAARAFCSEVIEGKVK